MNLSRQPFECVLGIFALVLVATAAQTAAYAASAHPLSPLRIGIGTAPKTLNPALAADAAGARILQLTHPALLRWSATYHPEGHAAQSCTQQKPTQIICTLPQGRRYTNGVPFTASSVATWYGALQTNPRSPLSGALKNVSITAPDPLTVVFDLPSPALTFFSTLVETPLADSASGAGLGPWVASQEEATGVVHLSHTFAKRPTLAFIPLSDPTTRILKLKKGEVDVLVNDLPPTLIHYAQTQAAAQGWTLLSAPSSSYSYIALNFRNPVLANPAVREALSSALNRPLLRKALLADMAQPTESLLPLGHPARLSVPDDTYDVLHAEGLLDETTLPDGSTLFMGPEDTRTTLTLLTSTEAFSQRLGQALQAEWGKIGIAIKLESAEWGSFFSRIQQGQFDMAFLTWTGEQQPLFYHQLFHSSQTPPNGFNRGAVNDATLDALTTTMKEASTPEALIAATQAVQKQVAEVRPYLPLWRRNHVVVMGKGIVGCTIPLSGAYTGLTNCARE